MRTLVLLTAAALQAETATEIMTKVAENLERAAVERRQFLYEQTVRSRMLRTNGKVARQETRHYAVLPTPTGTEKKLVSVQGEIHKGARIIPYTDPDTQGGGIDLDGGLINGLTEGWIDDKDSRDGIPKSLFPLGSDALGKYDFRLHETKEQKGRLTHHLTFSPKKGAEDAHWKGDLYIDAAEYQPVQIATDLALKIPLFLRTVFGTNVRQTGFAISYQRVAENVWFPVSYGSEFRLDLFFGYKRIITMALSSSGFRRATADSTIRFGGEK
jgi:hypothetical protein